MTVAAVADTHAALWYLLDDPRLSPPAGAWMDEAAHSRHRIAISSISVVEVVYLVEKGRLPSLAYDELIGALKNPNHIFVESPVSAAVAAFMRLVARDEIPDMPDRIVAATGLHFGVPVISRDGKIQASSVTTIW